jgi:hypothetical protein
MKYAVISNVNGNFKIESEHGENLQGAIVAFYQTCAAFWNAPEVETAKVEVVDEALNVVDGKAEFISHVESEEEA